MNTQPAIRASNNIAPAVSLIIPTFNRAGMIADTVASARHAGSNVEIIVVDDASTDDTQKVCAGIEDIKYIRLPKNSGTSAARNVAIAASSAEFIAFLDDDDLRLPGTLDRQVALLRAAPDAAFVYARAFIGDARFSLPTGGMIPGDCPTGDIYWQLLEGNFIPTLTIVARKQRVIEAGLFNQGLETMEDYDLVLRMAERHAVVALDEPVAIYRRRSETSGQKTSDRSSHERHYKKFYGALLRSDRARAAPASQRRGVHRRHLRMIYASLVHDAANALVNGHARAAQSYLWAAVRLDPLHIKAHVSLLWLLGRNLRQKLE